MPRSNMSIKLLLSTMLITQVAYGWDKKEVTQEINEYRGELKQEFSELSIDEKKDIREIKVWKHTELKELSLDFKKNLQEMNSDFDKKLKALDKVQRFKTSKHQKLVEKTFVKSIEIKEQRFLKKKEITDQYLTAKAEIEKEYMDKYHKIVKNYAQKKVANLNSNIPSFFPTQTEVQNDPWLTKHFCKEQSFYRKQQAKMDHKTYLFDLTVPIRKKREEAEVRLKIAAEEREFYKEASKSVTELSKHLGDKKGMVADFANKYDSAKKAYFVAEGNVNRLKKTISEISTSLRNEKARKNFDCDPTEPIAQVKIKE